jgi:tetratricopeptide (TPR) repeat protein
LDISLYFIQAFRYFRAMSPIESPDAFHVAAAVGWLELGNPAEAAVELAKINPALLEHPDVLEIRWQVEAAQPNWEAALAIAERIIEVAPEKDTGWLHRAYALRRIKGGTIEKAWQALRPAFELFPKTWLIGYNLACYATQLGRLEEAWEWLQKAIAGAGDIDHVRRMALADSDLAPLWDRIRTL